MHSDRWLVLSKYGQVAGHNGEDDYSWLKMLHMFAVPSPSPRLMVKLKQRLIERVIFSQFMSSLSSVLVGRCLARKVYRSAPYHTYVLRTEYNNTVYLYVIMETGHTPIYDTYGYIRVHMYLYIASCNSIPYSLLNLF